MRCAPALPALLPAVRVVVCRVLKEVKHGVHMLACDLMHCAARQTWSLNTCISKMYRHYRTEEAGYAHALVRVAIVCC